MILFLTFTSSSQCQVEGLWEITDVKVGSESMTPTAKWTRINPDGTYESGNGWLKNSEGKWQFDEHKKLFSPQETNGLDEDFGPFSVNFLKNLMIWERVENSDSVQVKLKRISELPMAPADMIVGLWSTAKFWNSEIDSTIYFNPEEAVSFLMRWDRIYIEIGSKGERSTGYWHMNGHRPHLTLIPHNNEKELETWDVWFNDSLMIWNGISDSNREDLIEFVRLDKFPNK